VVRCKPHAELGLERGETAHDRGQRAAERARGGREAAAIGDCHEHLHGPELVHRRILIRSAQE